MEEELQIRKGQNESYAVGLESMKYQHKFVIFNIYTDRHRYIISVFMQEFNTSLIAQLAKNLPAMQDLPDPDGEESTCNAGDLGSIPGSGRSPGEGNGNPLFGNRFFSRILAWEEFCPWTEETDGLQCMVTKSQT